MENHGAFSSNLTPIFVTDFDAIEVDFSACGRVDESHESQHCGFSRSVWTCDGEDFSLSDFETHVVKGCYVSVVFGYIREFCEGLHDLRS